jgi:hypothetical protein
MKLQIFSFVNNEAIINDTDKAFASIRRVYKLERIHARLIIKGFSQDTLKSRPPLG